MNRLGTHFSSVAHSEIDFDSFNISFKKPMAACGISYKQVLSISPPCTPVLSCSKLQGKSSCSFLTHTNPTHQNPVDNPCSRIPETIPMQLIQREVFQMKLTLKELNMFLFIFLSIWKLREGEWSPRVLLCWVLNFPHRTQEFCVSHPWSLRATFPYQKAARVLAFLK